MDLEFLEKPTSSIKLKLHREIIQTNFYVRVVIHMLTNIDVVHIYNYIVMSGKIKCWNFF